MSTKKSAKNIAETVAEALTPSINDLGYEVWDVEYVKEGADYFLRITIDNDEGITLDDCEKVHRMIDPMLDELDPIEDSYHLEVSSPGIERDIRYEWHYEVLVGEKIELRLFAAIEAYPGQKSFVGILNGLDNGNVLIDVDGTEIRVPLKAISKAKTVYDF